MATTDSSENRQAKRMPVTLKIKFKSETLNQFIERYSVDISHGGIFIRTKDPLAVGTTLRFEFQLKDATPLIKGEGTVVWTREHDPARAGVAPGMGVRFDRLPNESQRVLEQILEQKSASADEVEDAEDEDDDDGGFKDSPTRVAPAALVDKLVSDDYSTRDSTPLPRPVPFHSDADDFPDETFEEATRVASLDQLVASTKSKEEAAEAEAEGEDGDDDDRAATSPVGPAVARADGGEAQDEDEAEDADDREAQAEADELAERRSAKPTTPAPHDGDSDDEAEDGGEAQLDDAETTVAAKAAAERRAEVATPAARDDDGGGNMPWIAAAAVILVLAGAGGFWFMSKGRDQARAEVPPAAEEPSAVEVAAAEPAPEPAEAPEPEVATVDIQIESEPAGATAALVGTDQRAPTPATFAVEPGKSYEVEISHPGHVAQVIEVEAGEELPVVELEPMKKLVRVTSTPPGAVAWVQGRRQRGTTPLDVEIDARLAKAEALAVKLRKPGFEVWTESIELGSGFTEQDGVLVHTVSAELARRQVARRPPEPRETPDATETGPAADTEADSGAAEEPAPSEPAAPTESAAAEPAETEPAPPAETEPAPTPEVSEPTEPAPPEESEPQSAPASEPTPAWTN